MGLTRDEAERCGLGHLYPEPAASAAPRGRRATGKNALGQNKTEATFDRYLADLKLRSIIADFQFEPMKLRLAGRTWLKIDFVVKRNDVTFAFIDIKGGPWEDDAAVKIKVAAEQFAWLGEFFVARKDRASIGGWDVRPVNRSGLGRLSIGIDWTV